MYSDYGITYKSKMPIQHITKLLISSKERKEEKEIYDMWLVMLPHLDSETAGSFEKFKQNHITRPIKATTKSPKQIEKEMLWVVDQYEQRKGK